MRTSVLVLGLVVLGACKEATTSAPVLSASASAAPPPVASGVPSTAPLFTYVEGIDELSFWPPTTLRLVRSSRTCMSQLSTGHDNMWTGPDVEAAYADADVQAALAPGARHSFIPEDDHDVITEGLLRIGTTTLDWKEEPCHFCVATPAGIQRLHHLLVGVMMNRRLLCP
jgi:hypothetical protein